MALISGLRSGSGIIERLRRAITRPKHGDRKIFGIGLTKTGTTTLGVCLAALGFRHLSCRRDLLVAYREGRLDEVFAAIDGHDSFEDWPYPLMYRELFERYGDRAQFVLTSRATPDLWLDSLKAHDLETDPEIHCRLLAYGFKNPRGAEGEHLAFYRHHHEAVEDFFERRSASDRLLKVCWETGDDWEELCDFLDLPIPSIPFPYAGGRIDPPSAAEREEPDAIERPMARLVRSTA